MRICIIIFNLLLIFRLCTGQTFSDYYEEGLKYAVIDSLDEAATCFKLALKFRNIDDKQARTYGMHFVEYYPNRELGIIYYKQNDLDMAINYLEKSMNNEPSDRAKEYLLYIGQVKHDLALSLVDDDFPEIEVFSPAMINQRIFQPVANHINQITLVGRARDAGGVFEVVVNDTTALVSATGDFKAQVNLKVGDNDIYVKATDMSRNIVTKSYFIHRNDTVISEIASLTDGGKYYAFVIGISDYADPQITDLDGYPLQDVEKLTQILTDHYTFTKETTIVLKNPGRAEIQRTFDDLSKMITDKDNLLIFYAGHGHYDEVSELGYWLPADAEKEYTANWIYNDVLVANLKRIRSRHTLLISDACFSGSIFKERSIDTDAPKAFQKKYELKSRKAITSGVLQTVPNKSVFFRYLSDRLESNQAKYLSASQLFQDIEIPVGNNSPNTPQFGVIRNVGDEGGDFIFILK
ncbi:MAG: caspase family protein [Bacteroidales bacterium]|nr:caspase family protein [Bacteroidales bacterium]